MNTYQVKQEGDTYIIEPEQVDDITIKKAAHRREDKFQGTQQDQEIDTSVVDPKKTFEKFYNEQTEYSIYRQNPASQGIQETPVERINRLKSELNELKESLSLMSEKQKEETKLIGQGNVLDEVQALEKDISNVANNEEFKDLFSVSGQGFKYDSNLGLLKKDFQQSLTDKLKTQIQTISNQKEGEHGKIEIYLDKEASTLQEQGKYLDLENRVNALEEMLGKPELKQENYKGQNTSLIAKVEFLQKLVGMLNDQSLEAMGLKIEKIKTDIETLQKDKKLGSYDNMNPSNIKKINELHEKMQNISGIQDELPLLIQRLESLKYIHNESAGFMVNMSNLNTLHNQVIQQLGTNETLLTKLQTNFEGNLSNVKKNINNLEERIGKLE